MVRYHVVCQYKGMRWDEWRHVGTYSSHELAQVECEILDCEGYIARAYKSHDKLPSRLLRRLNQLGEWTAAKGLTQ